MRSAKFFSLLGLFVLAGMMVFVIGCGGDDDAPTSGTTIGSLTDPNFMVVQDQVDDFVDSTLQNILTGFGSIESISTGGNVDPVLYGPVFPDSDLVVISYINGWHVVDLVKSRSNYAFGIIDSVQFWSNDNVSQNGIDVDSMWYRHHWSFDVPDTTVTHAVMEGHSGFDFRGLQSAEAVIDGYAATFAELNFISVDSNVIWQFEVDSDVSDLVIEQAPGGWDQAIPTSGTISATFEVTYAKDDTTPVIATWTVTVEFTDGNANVTVQNGTVVWTYVS